MYRRRLKTVPSSKQSSSYSSISSTSGNLSGVRDASTTRGEPTVPVPDKSSNLSSVNSSRRSPSPGDIFDDEDAEEVNITPPPKAKKSKNRDSSNSLLYSSSKKQIGIPATVSPIRVNSQKHNRNDANGVMRMLTTPPQSPLKKRRAVSRKLTYMEDLLVNCGITFKEDSFEDFNVLSEDQAVFVNNVTKALKHDKRRLSVQQCVSNFMDDVESVFSDKKMFKTALHPCKTDADCNIARGDFQDSLMRLLLSVDHLQQKILEYLLDKIAEYIAEDSHDENESGIMWTRLILQQLRHLNKILNSSDITQRLFDVIHSSSDLTVQHEIINCLPDIIGDDQREQVADELIQLMRSEKELTASILIALENLCLDSSRVEQLQLNVIKSMRRAPLQNLPACIKFVLSNTSSVNDEIINGIRSELIIYQPELIQSTQAQLPPDLSSTQLLIFERLRDSTLMSRKLCENWLKNISKLPCNSQHRPIDIIMLLILHSTSVDQTRRKAVETIFRTKIKLGAFKDDIIKDTISVLKDIIRQNLKDFLKIASVLLQTNDVVVSQFGAFMYKECFITFESQWRKSIVMELLDLARMTYGSRPALTLLHTLTVEHQRKISPFITLIMLMLDCVTELSVTETRQLMDILCMVAFGDPGDTSIDSSSFQDEIYMLVQKQLACPDMSVFRSGIVCTIMAIKHMISISENQSDNTPNMSSIDEENIILTGEAKKAFNLLELVLVGTSSNPEALVLTYDQLSYVIMTSKNLDKSFIRKMSSLMQGNLQNHFIMASSEYKSKKDGLEASLQFGLDDDLEDPIAVNITEAVVKESNESRTQMPCVALPGLMRCVRTLEAADLTEIDALLGCSISLPDLSLFNKFSIVEPHIQRLALDSLFHTVNWFREIINCFVTFINEGKSDKVLKRLRLLIHLQGLIANCLPKAVQYQPPTCYFSSLGQKSNIDKSKKVGNSSGTGKRGRSKKQVDKDKENDGDETIAPNDNSDDDAEDDTEELVAAVPYSSFRNNLREMDFETCSLIALPLTFTPVPLKDGAFSCEFGPKELMFVLDDLVSKLRHVMTQKKPGPFATRLEPGFDNLSSIPINVIVKRFSKLATPLSKHMQEIVEYSHNLIKVHDGIWDAAGMFAPGTSEIKQCLSLLLSAFEVYLSWPSIRNDCYTKPLTCVLMKLGSVSKEQAVSLNVVLQHCVSYLKMVTECIMDLPSAINIIALIKTLLSYQDTDDNPVEVDLGEICQNYLIRRWYSGKGEEMKGSECNKHITALLDVYLSLPGALSIISSIMDWLPSECEALGEQASLQTYPHIVKSNLSVLIKVICKGLAGAIKCDLEGKDYSNQLAVWDDGLTSLYGLTSVLKAQDSKVNLRVFLKGSLPILKLFLAQGVSVCSCMFKLESLVVSQLLKKLQVVTRYIQTVCNYSKVTKDGSMIQQLPVMRGCLESIVLAVKNMVLQNKCTDAFFMGAMRNKGLKGEIIPSQDDEEEEESTAYNGDNAISAAESAADSDRDENQSDNDDPSC